MLVGCAFVVFSTRPCAHNAVRAMHHSRILDVSTVTDTKIDDYLTLPSGWAGCYTCPALRPYQFGPMCNPRCNHKVTVIGCEAEKSPATWDW